MTTVRVASRAAATCVDIRRTGVEGRGARRPAAAPRKFFALSGGERPPLKSFVFDCMLKLTLENYFLHQERDLAHSGP